MFEDNLQQRIFLDFVDIFWRDYCSLFLFFVFFPPYLYPSIYFFPFPFVVPPFSPVRGGAAVASAPRTATPRIDGAPLVVGLEREREKRREVTAYGENNRYLEALCAHVYMYSCARDFLFCFLLFCHPRTTLILTNHLPNFNRCAGLVCCYNII